MNPPSIKKPRKQRTAKYPLLREHREALGWSVQDLIARLNGSGLSESSVRRLEQGYGIRSENANRVFNAVAKEYKPDLKREKCVFIDD